MYHRPRIIPVVSLIGQRMVKTVKFSRPRYLGDPINAVKLFNGKDADELSILDIRASAGHKAPDFDYLADIAGEAFMPLSYGGGVSDLDAAKRLFRIGYEKVILGTAFHENPTLVTEAAHFAGSQSISVCLDLRRDLFGRVRCVCRSGSVRTALDPVSAARRAEELGAGELLLNDVDRDGTMAGYDLALVRRVSDAVAIPVIACGGAGSVDDLRRVLTEGGAHAAAAGSLFVYYGANRAILINKPDERELIAAGIYREEEEEEP